MFDIIFRISQRMFLPTCQNEQALYRIFQESTKNISNVRMSQEVFLWHDRGLIFFAITRPMSLNYLDIKTVGNVGIFLE